ncbi:MAG: methyltransferase domain-containing protein [Myxococcales bacterium]|nr:methyltransferase domain-containing protein [Myxococcales bacterium]
MKTIDQVEPVCPDCLGALEAGDWGHRCTRCGTRWPSQDGFPKFFREREVRASDRFMRLFYNGLPALHDPLTTHFLPWLQRDTSEPVFRNAALRELDLPGLCRQARGERLHVLEVGIGAGANLPFIIDSLPPAARVTYWGLDLSRGMLGQCRKRLPCPPLDIRLMLGDAHSLPFADQMFDRVFHIGAIASYGQPELALREMGRVAKPGTPIVVVDEQLDGARDNTLRDKLAFRLLTFYDRNPHCPTEKLPATATDVRSVQLSRFLYCLKFSMPDQAPGAARR